MHGSVMDFCQQAIRAYAGPVHRVLDVGAVDMNGSTRVLFPPGVEYVGIDVHDGPGVDWTGPAHEYPARGWDGRLFDALVSTECLEHDRFWHLTMRACCQLVRPGGLVVMTCATDLRLPHYTECWPDGYYRNLYERDLRPVFEGAAVSGRFRVERGNEDLYFAGLRGDPVACLDATGLPYRVELAGQARDVIVTLPEAFARQAGAPEIRSAWPTFSGAAAATLDALARARCLGRVDLE